MGLLLRFLVSDIFDRLGEGIVVLGVVGSLCLLKKLEGFLIQVAGMTLLIPVDHPEDDFEESIRFLMCNRVTMTRFSHWLKESILWAINQAQTVMCILILHF